MRPKFVKKTIEIEVAKGVKIYGNICQQLNFTLGSPTVKYLHSIYLVDFFGNFGIDLSNNELKYSSETSAKHDSAAIVLVFKAGVFLFASSGL